MFRRKSFGIRGAGLRNIKKGKVEETIDVKK